MNSGDGHTSEGLETSGVPPQSAQVGSEGSGADREALLRAVYWAWSLTKCLGSIGDKEGDPPSSLTLGFQGGRVDLYLRGNDIEDAAACFLMLDEIEKAGYVDFCLYKTRKGYRFTVEPENYSTPGLEDQVAGEGKTRAEAITRTFVACFREAPQGEQGGTHSPGPLPKDSGSSELRSREGGEK